MKNKLKVVLKKFQSYSFIIFLLLVLGAFFALAQLNNNTPKNNDDPTNQNNNNDNTTKVQNEVFKLPIGIEQPVVVRGMWDMDATAEEQAAAVIDLGNGQWVTNEGVNYQNTDGTSFDVLSSLSGTVTAVRQDSLQGYIVEIEHLYGVKTKYSSLESVTVAVGDKVEQGDAIGKSGECSYDEESEIHVHFEITQGNVRFNPKDMIGTGISELKDE